MQAYISLLTATLLAQAPTQTYEQAIAEVDALSDKINLGEPVNTELIEVLTELPHHTPSIAADPEAQTIRIRAQLNLARSFLVEGDPESAAGVMDDILRSTIGEELPVAEFGPALVALHAKRQAALASLGTGSIEVRCRVPCRVYINERESTERVDGLYLGLYRIWIESASNAGDVAIDRVNLTESNPTAVVEFAPAPEPRVDLESKLLPRLHTRIMPEGAEVALIAVGSSVALIGLVLLAINRAEQPTGASAESAAPRAGFKAAGATMLGVGGAALVIGGITLGVDEVRIGRLRGQQATIGWRMNF